MILLQFFAGLLLMQASPPTGPSVVGFATQVQSNLPRDFGDYSMVGARADGDLLVLTLDGPRGWRQRIPQADVDRDAVLGLCGESDFLSTIRASGLRVDRLEEGRDLQAGPVIPGCPQSRR